MSPKLKKAYAVKKVKRMINGFKMGSGRMTTGTVPKIGPDLPDKHNPVIVRVMTRNELATIPRDRYEVRVIRVMVPLLAIDAEGGHKAYVNAPSRTYADFVNTWGLQRGDQVTFVTVQKRQGRYEVNYARIVLNPRNADGSGAPMTTEIVNSQGEFPCSNWKNQLNFSPYPDCHRL